MLVKDLVSLFNRNKFNILIQRMGVPHVELYGDKNIPLSKHDNLVVSGVEVEVVNGKTCIILYIAE